MPPGCTSSLVWLGIPWLIVASNGAINLPIWKTTDAGQQPGGGITGGLAALYAAVLLARLATGPFVVVTTWRAGWDDLGPG